MSEKIFIKPTNPDIKVRRLKGGHLNINGEYVPREIYYLKRIQDGDLVQLTDEAEIKKAQTKTKTESKKASANSKTTDKEL